MALPLAIAFGSLLGTSANAQQTVALGDATISTCSFGQTSAPDKACYTEVRTFEIAPNDSAAISSLLAERGWRLATPEEVAAAWENLGLDTTSFYKMSDGRFAVPSQNGIGAVFQRGVNFRDPGVATFAKGIFYVDARAPIQPSVVTAEATITPDAPTAKLDAQNTTQQSNGCPAGQNVVEMNGQLVCSTPITLSGPANDSAPIAISQDGPIPQQFFTDQAADRCADPGNFMLDGWNTNERPVLEEAARTLFPRLGWADSSTSMTRLISALQSDPDVRWQFAPFMIDAAWKALTVPNPTGAQRGFKSRFETWAGCDKNLTARRNVGRWNQAMGRSIDASINGVSVEWIDPNPSYRPATLGVLNDTGPSIGSTGYDVTNDGNPMYIGAKGRAALQALLKPISLQTLPDLDDMEGLRLLHASSPTFSFAGEAAFGVTALSGLISSMGINNKAFDFVLGGKSRILTQQAKLAGKRGGDLGKQWTQTYVDDALSKGKSLTQAKAEAAIEWAKKGVDDVGKAAAKKTGSSLADDALRGTVQNLSDDALRQVATRWGSESGKRLLQLTGRQITPRFLASAAGPVLSGVSLFASVFGEKLADFVKTADYEAALLRDIKTYEPLNVAELLGPNPDEARQVAVASLMMKMLVAEPADRNKLTLAVPGLVCAMGYYDAGDACIRDVEFYALANVSIERANEIARQNGWALAEGSDVILAWEAGKLDTYSFGMLDDGRFAVPVQRDYPNFSKGHNVGASGGNQGFFYVQDFVSPAIAKGGATYIQNGADLEKFIVYENTFQANANTTGPGNHFASWSFEKVAGGDEHYRIFSTAMGGKNYITSGLTVAVAGSDNVWKVIKADETFYRVQSVSKPHQYLTLDNGRLELDHVAPNEKAALWHISLPPGEASFAYQPNEFSPVPGFVRLQNQWYKNLYINNEGQQLSLGEIQPNWWSAMWKKIPTVAGFFLLQNRYRPTEYLHIQNGKLELGPIAGGEPWWSAQWREVPTGDGWVQIQNRWKTDHYLNNSSGPTGTLEAIPVQPNWASAKWKVK
ncbi:RICIN domain-containing protein [Altererythrobacter epoxidivorans]|uniref:RICIN domain-containing protein n=1 Tax=Altererythrobacter epoxidivorans TaxID=361183 RepID=UPI0012ED9268|nr:hypothetical protein [Altererythrobacter epoxidivorans]